MKRVDNWMQRLHGLIATSQAVTFAWGRYDCAMFVCAAVREITGVDIGLPYRGTYSDEAGAEKLFLSGHADLNSFAASIAAANGMPEVDPQFSRRGDVVWVDNKTQYGALGVVGLDARFALCMSDQGLAPVHMQHWKRAWRVG